LRSRKSQRIRRRVLFMAKASAGGASRVHGFRIFAGEAGGAV